MKKAMTKIIDRISFFRWCRDEAASAVAEFALIFPILFTIMIAVWDVGHGIIISQKTISASQIIADLISRQISVSDEELQEALWAGQLAFDPYDTDSVEIQIVSVRFDSDDEPVVLWSYSTEGLSENGGLASRTMGLGVEGDGAIAVLVTYVYEPMLGTLVLDEIDMAEIAFARGRKSATVARDGVDS